MNRNLPKERDGVGVTEELVGWLVVDLGVDRASRQKGGGDHFRLPGHGRSSNKVRPVFARLDRAEALLRQAASDNAGGFGRSGVKGAGMRMMGVRQSMGQIQSVGREILAGARGQVGAEAVDKAIVAFAGLSQLM